jgi:glycogen phosphorylase
MNDTHPTLLVPELMRVLMDLEGLGWTKAWDLVTQVCNFTNHTVLPEALEKWPITMLEKLLPRHTQIIYDINWRFLQTVRTKFGDDWEKISKLSIIEETDDGQKNVRMAVLAVVASKNVNGVAAIHSDILKHDVFKAFYDLWPEKFQNKTNGASLLDDDGCGSGSGRERPYPYPYPYPSAFLTPTRDHTAPNSKRSQA